MSLDIATPGSPNKSPATFSQPPLDSYFHTFWLLLKPPFFIPNRAPQILNWRILVWMNHSCHILPFQPILWNRYLPSEPGKTTKKGPQSISEGGRIWQVGIWHVLNDQHDIPHAATTCYTLCIQHTPHKHSTHWYNVWLICICATCMYILHLWIIFYINDWEHEVWYM